MPVTTGPNDQDSPWSEGPSDRPETCDNCGEIKYESDVESCGGCGFKWTEIDHAVKVVDAVAEALGVDTVTISEARFHKAVEAALGEIVDPELPSDLV